MSNKEMEVELDEFGFLKCPLYPGDTNLHHDIVTVFSRDGEDQNGIKTRIEGFDQRLKRLERKKPIVITEPVYDSEMPNRRDTVCIRFWCEQCDFSGTLEIFQHKGSTGLVWKVPKLSGVANTE